MDKQAFNPFLPLDEYISDGEPHVFGDRVYLFGSHDKEGGNAFCQLDYVAYSAPVANLNDWRCEGVIYRREQDPNVTQKRRNMYAPDVVQGNDGRYYLYYTLEGFLGPISVAVCDIPAGKYEYYGDVKNADGTLFLRRIPFDPAVLNDEGTVRLYYGWGLPLAPSTLSKLVMPLIGKSLFGKYRDPGCTMNIMGANTVVLADDMLTVKSEPNRIIPCRMDGKGTSFSDHPFYEASSIRKIEGTYYFIYSSHLNHELCYATSKHPDKGFRYGGTIISNGDIGYKGRKEKDRTNTTGNNHGSIECINGRWYVFYHRHTHASSYSRQACAEPINIDEDGNIEQCEMTSCGLNGGPLTARGMYPASIACSISDERMEHIVNGRGRKSKPHITSQESERFITSIHDKTQIGFKYFHFSGRCHLSVEYRGNGMGKVIIRTEGHGKSYGEIRIDAGKEWTVSGAPIAVKGTYPLFLEYIGVGRIEIKSIVFRETSSA